MEAENGRARNCVFLMHLARGSEIIIFLTPKNNKTINLLRQ